MCKLDLKDAYFNVPLDRNSRKFIRFQSKGALYKFICLYFGLGPAPRMFTKLLKIPDSLLKKINVRVIIYLDDMMILSPTIPEAHMSRDTISPAKFELYNKYKEINFAPMSENRISGNEDRFNQNHFVTDTGKGTKSTQDLSEPSQVKFYNSSRIDQGCGSPIIHNTSSGTCKDFVKISSIRTNCVSKEKNELSVSNNINYQVKNRVNLVDRELEVLQ